MFMNGYVATLAMDSATIKSQEELCWKKYEESGCAANKQYDGNLGSLLFWLFGKEDEAYEEHKAYLRMQSEFKVDALTEEEKRAYFEFLHDSPMMPTFEAEYVDDVEVTDYAEKYMEQKGRVRMKRRSARRYKAYERGGARNRNHEMHVAHAENVCQKASASKNNYRKDCEDQMEMHENAIREAQCQEEMQAAWVKYEDEKYYLDRREYSCSFYDPMSYYGDPDGEEKDWDEHNAFVEAMDNPEPTEEERDAVYEFLNGQPEEIPDIDETVFAREHRSLKGNVTARRIFNRRHKAYERNGGLKVNRSRHMERLRNNVHCHYDVWLDDIFNPVVRGTINTSRRCADKRAIREGIQEMHLEMQELHSVAA